MAPLAINANAGLAAAVLGILQLAALAPRLSRRSGSTEPAVGLGLVLGAGSAWAFAAAVRKALPKAPLRYGAALIFWALIHLIGRKLNAGSASGGGGRLRFGIEDAYKAPPGVRLIQAQVVFRHGARFPGSDLEPLAPAASCEWQKAEQWTAERWAELQETPLLPIEIVDAKGRARGMKDMDAGKRALKGGGTANELTVVGMQQSVDLGRRLRDRYVESEQPLLPDGGAYNEAKILTKSTRVTRTVLTAQGVLSGLCSTDRRAAGGWEVEDAKAIVRLNAGPQWMVLNDTPRTCPNLRKLFRPVLMDVPDADRALASEIAKVMGMNSAHHLFPLAVNAAKDKALLATATADEKASLYALYRQATTGVCTEQRPAVVAYHAATPGTVKGQGPIDMYDTSDEGRVVKNPKAAEAKTLREEESSRRSLAHWQAWTDLGEMSAEEAQARYVKLVHNLRILQHAPASPTPLSTSPGTLNDYFVARRAHGKGLPQGVSDAQAADIGRLSKEHMLRAFSGGSPDKRAQTLRLNVGRMLQHFVNVMHNAGRGGGVDDGVDKVAGDPSMVLYSGHDWTLMPLLMVLSGPAHSDTWPQYAADLTLELWESGDDTEESRIGSGGSGSDDFVGRNTTPRMANRWVRVLYCGRRLPLAAACTGETTAASPQLAEAGFVALKDFVRFLEDGDFLIKSPEQFARESGAGGAGPPAGSPGRGRGGGASGLDPSRS